MTIVLSDLFTEAEAQVLHQAAQALSFTDGAVTAGAQARGQKQNQQASDTPERAALLDKVRATLLAHAGVQALAYPARFAGLLISRTGPGGGYGTHVDNALMAGGRADLSFTIFLSPPDSYAGGALVIEDPSEDRAFRLNRGEMLLYPSDTLHRVDRVTQGTRLAIVGWIESRIRDPRARDILFDLWRAETTARAQGDADQALLIGKSRSNLLRLWAD